MPRFARVVVPECPHHITQRGNDRRDLFFSSADRDVYLGLLRHCGQIYLVDVLGHCLMTNHVHLVLLPHAFASLGQLMREVQMRYSQYRHAIEGGSGHIWQCRYYSCAMEPARLAAVMRYVELNPVRAGMVTSADAYRWSSATVHLGGPDGWNLVALADWRQAWTPDQWRAVLAGGAEESAAIREATYGGRPLGSREFVARLERYLDRSLQRGSPGRPRRNTIASGACKI